MSYLRAGQTSIPLVCLIIAHSLAVARCDDQIRRLPDGRYLVQVKDVTVGLPEEDPKSTHILFAVATPPGTNPFSFTLIDLLRDPDRYAPKLRSSDWSSVSAGTSVDNSILGMQVVRGVIKVGVRSGVDKNCEAWNQSWARYREAAIATPADQYGWIRQDDRRSPSTSRFLKFLDERDRATSRYHGLNCDFFGLCLLSACHNELTAWIQIKSSNKPRGEDFAIKSFDEQIASGTKVLEHMLMNRSADLSHP
jgi:hypothetical protein